MEDPRHNNKGSVDDNEVARQAKKEGEFFGFEVKSEEQAPESAKSFIAPSTIPV